MWLTATVLNITELVSLGGKHHEKNRIFTQRCRTFQDVLRRECNSKTHPAVWSAVGAVGVGGVRTGAKG